jgi:hypothetical protein
MAPVFSVTPENFHVVMKFTSHYISTLRSQKLATGTYLDSSQSNSHRDNLFFKVLILSYLRLKVNIWKYKILLLIGLKETEANCFVEWISRVYMKDFFFFTRSISYRLKSQISLQVWETWMTIWVSITFRKVSEGTSQLQTSSKNSLVITSQSSINCGLTNAHDY